MCRVDWKGVAYSAGLAVLSALVVGLFVQNRRLSHELRKKHEVGACCNWMWCNWQIALSLDPFHCFTILCAAILWHNVESIIVTLRSRKTWNVVGASYTK